VHEKCTATGEILVSLAGRIAKAYLAETRGVFQPNWTIEQVAGQMDAIGNTREQAVFPAFPRGFYDHLEYSFRMARGE
jgi:hypothetical protein